MDRIIGKKLDGRYELLELIGAGGMADVYKATDIVDGSEVAVKILKKEFSENEEFLRRFRNESKAIALLSHPNIVKILDVGFTNKIQFMVMEYIDGITLKEYMEKEKVLDWKTASFFTIQVLKALQHAHDRGIVHRDIKPQNIMMLTDGTIKVMDFGIAKFAREEGLTTTAQAIGSVHYISPEQARSDTTDEKSDIYSVGIVLYEMLTGVKPFDNTNPVSVALMHMQTKAKRPRAVNPDIPRGLEEIILRAIEKEPCDRYFSAAEMINDIELFKSSPEMTFGYYKEEEDENMDRDNNSNDSNTKFFKPLETGPARQSKVKTKKPEKDKDSIDEIVEEEYVEKRSMFVPILSGVVIVIVILGVIFVFGLLVNYFGGSSDNKEFQIQNFVGLDYEYVKKQYGNKLSFKIKSSINDEQPANTILWQSIAEATTVKPGTEIEVNLSLGEKMISVTTIDNNFTFEQAKSCLEEDGFTVVQKIDYSNDVKKDYVIKTVPEANTKLKKGSAVEVYVSRGPIVTEVTIPDLKGKKEEEARAILEDDLGLKVISLRINAPEYPEGLVASQSHSANQKVETGTEVTIYISTGVAENTTRTLDVNFPENAYGLFTFEAYVDGKLVKQDTDVNPDYTTKKTMDIVSSGGKKQVVIKVINQANNQSAEVCRYELSFDQEKTTSLLSDDVLSAFKQIDGIKQHVAVTQAPVVTTQAPEVTTQAEADTPSDGSTEGTAASGGEG